MKIGKIRICPICVVVSGTWIALLVARYLGYPVDLTLIAMLMGGSAVGISYTLEKKLPAGRSGMAWKFISIAGGFMLVYGFLIGQWILGGIGVVAAGTAAAVFFRRGNAPADSKTAQDLKEKMKKCC